MIIPVEFDAGDNFAVQFGGVTDNEYFGPTEITPGTEDITLETANKKLNQNITINAIPSNYGLIEWDGTILTIR